jgi:RloB-like protein
VGKHDSLRRRRARFQPRPRFLIVCEGTVTEPCYFRAARHVERGLIELEIEPGSTPKTIVERAVKLKKQADRDAKRRADDNLKYDEIWCVFDVDDHRLISEAKEQAKANGVQVAVSNPCFELWALLHFQDQRKHIERSKVQRLCATHIPGYKKELSYEFLRSKYSDALQRAEDLEKWHESRSTSGENPSTTVHKLIERIRAHRGPVIPPTRRAAP